MKKYNFLNICKFIMALFVVAVHINIFNIPIENKKFFINFAIFINPLVVQIFFLSTGFFIGKKIEDVENMKESDFDRIKKRFLKMIKLYIILTIVYMPMTIYGFIQYHCSIGKAVLFFIRNILFIGENFNSWILWYLLSEIYGLMLIYLLGKKTNNNNNFIYIGAILLLLGIVINYFNGFQFKSNIIILLQKIIINIIPNGRILYSPLFISLGIFISKHEKIKNNVLSTILLITLFILNIFLDSVIIHIISISICSYIIFKYIINIDIKEEKIADYLKLASVNLYFWHLFIWSIISYIIEGKVSNNYSINYYIITIAIIMLFTTIQYFLQERIKSLKS